MGVPLVESVCAAIEVVDDRYEDFKSRIPGSGGWIADDFFNAGIVLGQWVPLRKRSAAEQDAVTAGGAHEHGNEGAQKSADIHWNGKAGIDVDSLASVQGFMDISGEKVGNGFGRDIIDGHPLEALAWLLNKRVSQLQLSAGSVQGESHGGFPGQSAGAA